MASHDSSAGQKLEAAGPVTSGPPPSADCNISPDEAVPSPSMRTHPRGDPCALSAMYRMLYPPPLHKCMPQIEQTPSFLKVAFAAPP
eukprot:767669-Hanusia_phi.AAC.10